MPILVNLLIAHSFSSESMNMREPSDIRLQSVIQHLQSEDVQKRIHRYLQVGRDKAAVSIGRVRDAFGFSENQLRDWEKRGLLSTQRVADTASNDFKIGQRRYPPAELDKLAIIRELIDAGFRPSEIPINLSEIWSSITEKSPRSSSGADQDVSRPMPLEDCLDRADQEAFWHYFISQALRLSLQLISEDIPGNSIGLVLPLEKRISPDEITSSGDLSKLGESLIGWLSPNGAFYIVLDTPLFKYPSDYRIHPLIPYPELPDQTINHVFIFTQRQARPLLLSARLVTTISRFLELIYEYENTWRAGFEHLAMRESTHQISAFTSESGVADPVLDDLMNVVIGLGGRTADGEDRWHFCSLFLPQDDSLPRQPQVLQVHAQSKNSPSRVHKIVSSSRNPGLVFRAYQSGHIIYRPSISPLDDFVAYRRAEEETRSAIAIPIAGINGMAIASLYIASRDENAFTEADLRVLRIITRMIEELLTTSLTRQRQPGTLSDLLDSPEVVDLSFRNFLSEDNFIDELEELLTDILRQNNMKPQSRADLSLKASEVVSFIEIDIDNHSALATKYGDQVARNLSREVGLRIQGQLRILANPDYRKLYHISSDRYYIKLVGMSLDQARDLATALHNLLRGAYRLDPRRVTAGRPLAREFLLELPHVTTRIGVQSYTFERLKEILLRYPQERPIAEVRTLVMQNIDEALTRGQMEGGDVIISWDPEGQSFKIWAADNSGFV